ncbi:DEAD/DEAH box helicase [Peredibacter sp. HCB2-198]|uniref:DEAD/DEAH box helicase n=1 Tax=Peredibacter sp. HCB2-198 TaxID=3383025 RepID=UPI0038B63BF5
MAFLNVEFHPGLEAYFTEQGLKTATLVQKRVIPEIMNRKSVIVLSETGSGKTLSYALPIASKLKQKEDEGRKNTLKGAPYALIVAPTRELAVQIHGVFKSISHHLKLRVRDLTGGDTHAKMKSVASGSYEILIATPSRIKSAIQKKELNFNQLQYVIFDEADQLFDMGFKRDLDFMIEYLDMNQVQLGFITATLPVEVENYIQEKFPETHFTRIASEVSHAPQSRIETFNVKVTPAEKDMVVRMFLEKQAQGRGIIFTNQRNQAEDLFKYLSEKMPKLKMKLLHGDLEKKDREAAIRSFVEGKQQILVATDVAARGIDIKDLAWVLNYGLPKTAIYYLHRCGRVGRGGKKGIVYNLVAYHDSKMISQINEAVMNQKHLNLDIIPEEKMKQDKPVVKKVVEKAPATFRGQKKNVRGAARVQKTEKELRNAPPAKVQRNRGIKRRR